MAKILIVDDEPDILEVTQKFFTRRGHETSTAAEGNEAVRVIQETNPDLIILDYNLPGINGKEILQKVREEFKLNTKIIMVTGYEKEMVINETKDLGIQGCLHKPLNLEDLEKTVLTALNDGKP